MLLVLALVTAVFAPVAVMAAGGTFTDDDDSIFEADIEWLASAGVTKGCNPPTNDLFCPNNSVTRGQMAAFMRRFAQFLGAEDGIVSQADNATTADYADNAGTVDNFDAKDLNRVSFDVDVEGDPVTVTGIVAVETIMSAEITAPTGGWITVSGQTNMTHNTDIGAAICQISVDTIDANPGADILDGSQTTEMPSEVDEMEGCSTQAAFMTFLGGTYTVNFDVAVFFQNTTVDEGTLVVNFTPFNGAGNGPISIILPPIITLGETAENLASTVPAIEEGLAEIQAALN